jgi:uncharacterized protein (DUF2147 family)
MTRNFLAAFAALALALVGGVRADTSSPVGVWLTEAQTAHVEIAPCGQALCGSIVWLKEPLDAAGTPKRDVNNPDETRRARALLGMNLLEGFVPASGGGWDSGTIYNPEDGKTYKCVMAFEDDGRLKVRGYVGVPLLGKTQLWTRVR